MEPIAYGQIPIASKGNPFTEGYKEVLSSMRGKNKGLFVDRGLTALIRVVLNVLKKLESWWYAFENYECTQRDGLRLQRHEDVKDNHVTEKDQNDGDTKPVNKKVDVPG
jgi:hypothetical protein